jgi:3-isopropylmalate/(R)-2-methylmalate dehydratase small subunit
MIATSSDATAEKVVCSFEINAFDRDLVSAGGWLAFADQKY